MNFSPRAMDDLLEPAAGFGLDFIQDLLGSWLKLDLTTLAAVLTIAGTISSTFRTLADFSVTVYWWFARFFTASISVPANDRLNREILNWVGSNVLLRQNTRILTAGTEPIETDSWHAKGREERNDYQHEKRIPITYLPTFGVTWFVHDGSIFMIKRVPTGRTIYRSSSSFYTPDEFQDAPTGDEPLVVICLGRSVAPIKRFLDTCRDFAEKQREDFVTVRTAKRDVYGQDGWNSMILRPVRPLETVHFDETTKTELVADISNYLDVKTRRFYAARGIPYRRGLLLYGPPGTGKTSLSLALAGHFGLELYLVHIPSIDEDKKLERLFAALPPRCIVLLEDIDAVGINKRHGTGDNSADEDDDDDDDKKTYADESRKITLAGLLNVLDGVASQEGRIVLMTSNFADRLDRALIRPGRIDRQIFLGNISPRSAELMFRRMYASDENNSTISGSIAVDEEELQKLAAAFANRVPPNTLTPAQLQGYLLERRDAPKQAVEDISQFVQDENKRAEEAKAREKRAAERRRKRRQENKLLRQLRREMDDEEAAKPQLDCSSTATLELEETQ
jgi:chaperone BCS1